MVLDITEIEFLYSTQASYSQVPCFFFFFFFLLLLLLQSSSTFLKLVKSKKMASIYIQSVIHFGQKKRSMNLVCMSGVVPGHLL